MSDERYIEVIIITINTLTKNGYLPNVYNILLLLKAMSVKQGKFFKYLNEDEHVELLVALNKWKPKRIRLVVDNTKQYQGKLNELDV